MTARPSLPSGRYGPECGEYGLLDPRRCPLDDSLANFVRSATSLDASTRADLRRTIGEDGAYLLLGFARRSSVFSLREGSSGPARDGLDACALLEGERIDPRDVLVALALLYHALERTGGHPEHAFRMSAERAHPDTAALIAGFARRSRAQRDLRDAWGWVETETASGVGLLGWGFRPYAPTLDLPAATIAVAEMLTADDYVAADQTIATELPSVWLRGVDDRRLDAILEAAPAAASVSARLRPEVSDLHAQQHSTAFLLETDAPASAATLLAISAAVRGEFVSVAAASGRLFCLLIARSFVQGVAHHESTASIARFKAPLQEVVDRYGGQ